MRKQTVSDARQNLRYSYEIDGRKYRGDRYALWGSMQANEDEVRAYANDHPSGEAVTVFYDPQNPAEAVLQPGADKDGGEAFLTLGGFAMVIGSGSLYIGLRILHDQKTKPR